MAKKMSKAAKKPMPMKKAAGKKAKTAKKGKKKGGY